MHCIAHRGFAGVNPENSLPAVRDAVRRLAGAGGTADTVDTAGRRPRDGVEVDVRRCASGELVVCHDETVDRTTDGSGAVADLTAAELDALSVEGSDAGVPTLAAVVDVVPPAVTLHAELKETGLGDDLESLAAGADCPVVVSSFLPDALRAVDGLPTTLATADAEGALETASSLGCEFVHPQLALCDEAFVGRAREAGLGVNAWTVREAAETRRLRDLGVDGVITDVPDCCPTSP